MFNIPGDRSPSPITVTLQVNQAEIQMEVDTGASVTIISSDTYTKLLPAAKHPPLQPSIRKLRTYTAEKLVVEGELTVDVRYQDQQKKLPLLVVAGKGPSLLGRDWLLHIRLDWQRLQNCHLLTTCIPSSTTTMLHSQKN